MSVDDRDEVVVRNINEMDEATFALWVEVGKRLLAGQKQYGGFKFGDYDLDQMALEELEDYIVYRAAKKLLGKG